MTGGDFATCKARPVLLFALVLLSVLHNVSTQVTLRKSHIRMQKLCSRSLSDALYLVCRERGYNEPFSYSGEDEPRVDPGPGLVEECCYHSCSYEQLERYCKPLPEEKRVDSRHDVMWVDVSVYFTFFSYLFFIFSLIQLILLLFVFFLRKSVFFLVNCINFYLCFFFYYCLIIKNILFLIYSCILHILLYQRNSLYFMCIYLFSPILLIIS